MAIKNGRLEPPRYNPREKSTNARHMVKYWLARTQRMFEYTGLPETIPRREYELMLQTGAHGVITEVEGKLYFFQGGLGGPLNPYYFPTAYTVNNPALLYNATLTIGKDCVLLRNDSAFIGLLPVLEKYCCMLAENQLSMHLADVNSRIIGFITAGTDSEKASAEEFFKKVERGEMGVIGSNAFLDSVKSLPYGDTAGVKQLTDLIEYEQYLKAGLANELGLNANYNMKRESINAGEIKLNLDYLLPFADDMLKSRRECWGEVNKKYGTNVTVDYSSAWEMLREGVTENAQTEVDGSNPDMESGGDISGPKDTGGSVGD